MTVDDRFAAHQFEALVSDPPALARLVEDLEDAVRAELHAIISEKLQEMVARLNGMGHRLLLETERPGEVQYHDPHEPPVGAHCWLRVGADTVV